MSLANNELLTVAHLAPLLKRRKLSPVEITRWFLERIDRHDRILNSYITVIADLALAQAAQAEREIAEGRHRGPLHGIPVCIKDLFFTRGVRTTAGSRILRRFTPGEDAAVVERLRHAGAVFLGKTNLHEFAYGPTNVNPHYGAVHNPWNPQRIAGGSSGGSAAAVCAGLAVAGLGTDTGGSIRIPAAACGCVGLKPTFGRVSLRGVVPLSATLDHAGPLCRSVEDAALLYWAMAEPQSPGPGAGVPVQGSFLRGMRAGVRGMKIGMPRQYFFDRLQPEVKLHVLSALGEMERLGAALVEVRLRGMGETAALAALITGPEALANHIHWLDKNPEKYGKDVCARLEGNRGIAALDYILALKKREAYGKRFAAALESVDVLAVPTLPVEAPEIGADEVTAGGAREDTRLALLRLTRPGNLAGGPAISIPCGFTSAGLPVGLQIMGRRSDEASVFRAAYAYEQSAPWRRMFPVFD